MPSWHVAFGQWFPEAGGEAGLDILPFICKLKKTGGDLCFYKLSWKHIQNTYNQGISTFKKWVCEDMKNSINSQMRCCCMTVISALWEAAAGIKLEFSLGNLVT